MKNNGKNIPVHLEMTLEYFNILQKEKQIDIDKVINVYTYGSVCYGTDTDDSDIDYIIVYDQSENESDTLIGYASKTQLNATLVSPEYFQSMIEENHINAIECLFLKKSWTFERIYYKFNINFKKLRHSISSVSSNSWVKAKKKILQGDIHIGQKSLFHSLRILDFGIQLAKYGKIDFTEPASNTLSKKYKSFYELLYNIKKIDNWNSLNDEYKSIYNEIKSEFKIVCPK